MDSKHFYKLTAGKQMLAKVEWQVIVPSVMAKDTKWTLEQIFLTNTGLNLVMAQVAPLIKIKGKVMLWIEYANKNMVDIELAFV